MAASAATAATPPFASRQRGGEGLFALKSLASAQPAGPRQQRSVREPKPVLSAGKSRLLQSKRDAAVSLLARRARRRGIGAVMPRFHFDVCTDGVPAQVPHWSSDEEGRRIGLK